MTAAPTRGAATHTAPQSYPPTIPSPKTPTDPALNWSLSHTAWRQLYTDPLTFPTSPSSPFETPYTARSPSSRAPVSEKIESTLPTQLARASSFQALKSFEIIARKAGETMGHDTAIVVLEKLADEEIRKLGEEWNLREGEMRRARWEAGGCVRGLYEGWYVKELGWADYDPGRGGLHRTLHDAGVLV